MQDQIREGIAYVRGALESINDEAADRALTDDEQARWDEGEAFIREQNALLERHESLRTLPAVKPMSADFHIAAATVAPEDGLRFDATDLEVRDAGMRALERTTGIDAATAEAAERTARSIVQGSKRSVYQRFIVTGTDAYRSAFAKYTDGLGNTLTPEESHAWQRAASLTNADGGFAVPFTLDPTIITTNDGVASSMRQLARNVSITTDSWNGVSSAGVTASWDGEAAEVSDDAPTLAQPSIPVHKAQAFVPFSIEIGQDWAGMDSDIRMMFADARDRLEGAAFMTGTGTNQPTGVTTALDGTASEIAPATAETFAVADVYAVANALGPRYRNARTSFIMEYGTANTIRQFDTTGGAALWETLGGPTPDQLIGFDAYEDSNLDDASAIDPAATADNFVLVVGDFQAGYTIVDRVGLSVELIPHLFATANNLPSGQRGLYAFWRVGGDSVNDAAMQMLSIPTTA